MEDRGRRASAAEWLIVPNIDPEPAGISLAFRQHRHGRVVAVQALGRHDMSLDEAPEGIERRRDRAHRVGHGGQRDRRALERIALPCQLRGWCWPKFSNTIIASRLGPAQALGITWNGAGAWLIVSQSRQENFSRTVSITFHRRGVVSSVRLPPFSCRRTHQRLPLG